MKDISVSYILVLVFSRVTSDGLESLDLLLKRVYIGREAIFSSPDVHRIDQFSFCDCN